MRLVWIVLQQRKVNAIKFEWNGVSPDVRIPQIGEDAEKGIDKQLEFAIKNIQL